MTDTVVIGAGHNGLAAAFYLARAGRRPLVLERSPVVGGGAITSEIHPGFRCPRLSHEVLLDGRIARDMELNRQGVAFIGDEMRTYAPDGAGRGITLFEDVARSVESLRSVSSKDAEAYAAFRAAVDRIAGVIGSTFDAPPPDIDAPSASDLWNLLKTGRRFRSLDERDEFRLLRWVPMPVGDLLSEWFGNDALKAMLAGPGVSGTMLGPRSAGSALVLLLREASRLRAGGRSLRIRGGPGALTRGMAAAATAAGAEIRTGVRVERILLQASTVVGVVADGKEIPCSAVVAAVDPRTTLLSLIDPSELDPDFARQARNYRAAGTVAKVNMALSALPPFAGASDPSVLSGRIHIGPDLDYLERAFDHVKYGEMSSSPWLDITIPSIADTELAPREAHVASVYVHYAPFGLRGSEWRVAKDVLLDNTLRVLEAHAPGFRSMVVAAEAITPAELQTEYGLSGGHIFHGELALDQLFTMRPLLGHARYRGPARRLYLSGAGAHPGGFMTGTSGRLASRALLDDRRP